MWLKSNLNKILLKSNYYSNLELLSIEKSDYALEILLNSTLDVLLDLELLIVSEFLLTNLVFVSSL